MKHSKKLLQDIGKRIHPSINRANKTSCTLCFQSSCNPSTRAISYKKFLYLNLPGLYPIGSLPNSDVSLFMIGILARSELFKMSPLPRMSDVDDCDIRHLTKLFIYFKPVSKKPASFRYLVSSFLILRCFRPLNQFTAISDPPDAPMRKKHMAFETLMSPEY